MSDNATKRGSRLQAIQARHKQAQPQATPGDSPPIDVIAPADPAGGGGAAAAPGGRAAMVQKLRKAMTKPDGGIDKEKAQKLLQFVRKQANDPNAPKHELAKKIANVIRNLDPEKRKRLLGMAGMGGIDAPAGGRRAALLAQASAPASGPADSPATGEAWFDDFVDKL